MQMHIQNVVIVGGGFGGIRCALRCAKLLPASVRITLIADKPYMQYYAAFYRALAGGDPMEACVPLSDIFGGSRVEVVRDAMTAVDTTKNVVRGASGAQYRFDRLVLAIGAEPSTFGIPGVAEHAYTLRSLEQTLRLKRHLHDVMTEAASLPEKERSAHANIVVIGGGATGVEVAGELAVYARTVAKTHGIAPSAVTIDLVEAMPRVLPLLEERVSRKVEKRLQQLGVHLFLNRGVEAEDTDSLKLRDVTFRSKTVIWTAGVKANSLYAAIPGVETDKRGRVVVDEHLRANGMNQIFVIGDGASTPLSGMAQTALQDADHAADCMAREVRDVTLQSYAPSKPAYAIPAGPSWAAVVYGPVRAFGRLGWWLRRAADLKVYMLYLSPLKALSAFRAGRRSIEACACCTMQKA